MRLINAMAWTGSPYEIPDCSRDDLPGFFAELGFKVGAEIGVSTGEFSGQFCKQGFEHYAIDSWPAKHRRRMNQAVDLLTPYPNCAIIWEKSEWALERFKDNSLDYVYIDADHHLPYVIADIHGWSRKVKPGGIVAGHDYFYSRRCHVAHAVNSYTFCYGIISWYLLGRKEMVEGEKRDKWRSWMWMKP